ncbi:MAG: threonylcarbamoyladenosine tRNA methylthiotransferase MtaB [Saprospiraceae bacterium]|jgi:threonylcarbamoyladenosine tRNA methylthiotransferase MtaB
MATPQTIAFHTLGCKLNFSETSTIRRQFEDRGYGTVNWEAPADIYILNTCSVTDFADKKCRSAVRKALRQRPEARIVVIGCYAQLKPDEIAEIPGVDLVLGAAEKFNVHNYIDSLSKTTDKGMVQAGAIQEVNSFEDAFSFGDRTRTFLKVQDGCDYKCTFCTIPQARGKSRSASINKTIANATEIASKGVKEVVLTGVNIGDYGIDVEGNRQATFLDLVKELDQVEGLERIRISSIEPNLCSDEIIDFVAGSNRFVPHFHMPLQSGSDRILGLMKRRYRSELYRDRVRHIKSVMPHCCIGVDVIVGFPGETDEDFQETVSFLKELDVSYLHVFTYSERAKTPAADMEDPVPMHIRKERNEILRQVSEKKKRAFYEQHLGQERIVLVEQSKKPERLTGFTDNYIKVELSPSQGSVNGLVSVNLKEINERGLVEVAS